MASPEGLPEEEAAPLPGIPFSVLLAILIPYVLLTGKLKTRVGLRGSFHPS